MNFGEMSPIGEKIKTEYADWTILERIGSKDSTGGSDSSGMFMGESMGVDDNDHMGSGWKSSPSWAFIVERNGVKKEIPVSEAEFKKYKEGGPINLKLEYYEKEGYVEGIKNRISKAENFESLENIIKSIGDLRGYGVYYCLNDILYDIELMKKGKDAETGYFAMLGNDVYGYRAKANELKEAVIKRKLEKQGNTFWSKITKKS